MSVAELQKKLIDKINNTNDAALLEDLYDLFGIDESPASFYQLSDTQMARIEQSQKQVKEGQHFTNDEVNKEIDEWLKK